MSGKTYAVTVGFTLTLGCILFLVRVTDRLTERIEILESDMDRVMDTTIDNATDIEELEQHALGTFDKAIESLKLTSTWIQNHQRRHDMSE